MKIRSRTRRFASGYGWVPDIPDRRDFLFAALAAKPAVLPQRIDLRGQCSPVENQGRLGSCTANALVGAVEFLEVRDRVRFEDLSRLFVYYNERVIEHTVATDSGAMLRDGMKSLVKLGVCSEQSWPYRISNYAVKPTNACYREASDHRVTSYHRIQTLEEMRRCLAERYPFVFGFTVYEGFESSQTARTGVVQMPRPDERTLGGHAVMAVGYDDADRRFLVRNSWGASWGMNGYCTMPFDYLADRNLSDDLWTVRRAAQF